MPDLVSAALLTTRYCNDGAVVTNMSSDLGAWLDGAAVSNDTSVLGATYLT